MKVTLITKRIQGQKELPCDKTNTTREEPSRKELFCTSEGTRPIGRVHFPIFAFHCGSYKDKPR